MKKSLQDVFELNKSKQCYLNINKTDNHIFKDKALLESLKTSIIEDIINDEIPKEKNINKYIDNQIDTLLKDHNLNNLEKNHLFNIIDSEINGYGPITEILENESVTEIMVNSPDEIYVEIEGKKIKEETISFINDKHIIQIINKLLKPLNIKITKDNPIIDTKLPNGLRLNAIIEPASIKGPIFTIRKFNNNINEIGDFIRKGTLTPYMARYLQAAVKAKLNILIYGGTSSGKTTTLNILSTFIDDDERIITIEDIKELDLNQEHVLPLETINIDNKNKLNTNDLLTNVLHMNPDRIILGEINQNNAYNTIQAMNTGNEGILSTVYANSSKDALNTLEEMILSNNKYKTSIVIKKDIEKAIAILVKVEK